MAIDQQLLEEMQTQTAILRGISGSRGSSTGTGGIAFGGGSNNSGIAAAAKDLAGTMGSVASKATDSVLALAGFNDNLKDGATAVKTFSSMFLMGGLGGIIANTIDQYKEFLNIGQSFNGNMLEMAETAAKSHQSMEELYKGFRAAGVAAATLGVERFSELSSAVREGARNFGSFGMTIEDINGFMGEQLDIRRMVGLLDSMDRNRMSRDFNDLHKQTMALSAATGKSREEILKSTMNAQKQSISFRAWAGTLTGSDAPEVLKRAELAMNAFSAMPEEIGQLLTSGLGDVLDGMPAAFSPVLRAFQGYAPGVNQAMDQLGEVINKGGDVQGAYSNVLKNIQNLDDQQVKYYKVLMRGGDEQARAILESWAALQGVNLDEIAEKQKQAGRFDALEETLLNFGQNLSMVGGEIRGAFLVMLKPAIEAIAGENGTGGPLGSLADAIKGLSGPDGFFAHLGQSFKTLITQVKEQLAPGVSDTATVVKRLAVKIKDVLAGLGKFIGFLDENGEVQLDKFFTNLSEGATWFIDLLYKMGAVFAKIANWFNLISDKELANVEASVRKREYGDAAGMLSTADKIASQYAGGSATGMSDKISLFPAGTRDDITNNISSLVKGILSDGEISKNESKLMRELMEKNIELQKSIMAETQRQTSIVGASLEEQMNGLKVQKSIERTAKQGGLGGL